MHAAAYNDHCESLQMLLSHGGEVNRPDSHGRTPLMLASINGQTGALEMLLESGSELNTLDHDRNTALHHACQNVSAYLQGIDLTKWREIK